MNWNFTVTIRFLVDSKTVPRWRLSLFGLCAKALGVPVQVADISPSVLVTGPKEIQ